MSNDKLIKNIQRNSVEILRVSLNEFKNSKFLSLRFFYDSSGRGTSWLPGRKGVAIPLSLLNDLSEAIKEAIESVESWEAGIDSQ